MKRNPDATCDTCPYWARIMAYGGSGGGGQFPTKKGICDRFPRKVKKRQADVCGEHPEFKRYWAEGE